MCNLYSITTNQAAIIALFRVTWPIVAPTFVVMTKKPSDAAAAAEALHFFKWAYKNGDKAQEVVPMPSSVVDKVELIWSAEIKDAAERPILLRPNP
jgi:hypothetical protein